MPAKTNDSLTPQAKGGLARKDSLSPPERSEIARKAAEARWAMPQATHAGVLEIGNAEIPCYVLENGERILSTRGVMKALRRRWRGRKHTGTQLPVFLEAKNLKPFIDNDLDMVLAPVEFRPPRGAKSEGFRAEILPMVCETYLKARDAGELTPQQIPVAAQCDILIRGLSRVGVIALVDEATGYQEVRDLLALQTILDRYLTDEWAKWTKTFPADFYRELFRLNGIDYPGTGTPKPSYVGHWTNDIVYSRIQPGILRELKHKNPRLPSGSRARKHHQYFTRDIGHPELRDHISKIIFLMKGCTSWDDFKRRLNRAAPKFGDTIPMELGDA